MDRRRWHAFHYAWSALQGVSGTRVALFLLLCLVARPAGALAPAGPQPSDAAPQVPHRAPGGDMGAGDVPPDLTQLSLEQLLEIEVIPINVLGSHTHLAGETMIGYRFMGMDMEGNRTGTRRVSVGEVLEQYPVAHTRMTMAMHMIEAMYAPDDDLTLMLMLPYERMEMNHLTRTGTRFTTVSEGLGDVTLMVLRTFKGDVRKGGSRLLLNTGISFPTGSVNKRDDTPTTRNAKLEYAMQLGSGTFDLLPGVTYLRETKNWAFGAQSIATVRLGKNTEHYRLGNEFRLGAWAVRKVTDWFAPSVRLDWHRWGNVHGRDPELNPAANSAFDPNLQKGRRLDLLIGLNVYAPHGRLRGHRLTLEAGVPIYQSLAGPQVETDWQWNLGWSYTFGH